MIVLLYVAFGNYLCIRYVVDRQIKIPFTLNKCPLSIKLVYYRIRNSMYGMHAHAHVPRGPLVFSLRPFSLPCPQPHPRNTRRSRPPVTKENKPACHLLCDGSSRNRSRGQRVRALLVLVLRCTKHHDRAQNVILVIHIRVTHHDFS